MMSKLTLYLPERARHLFPRDPWQFGNFCAWDRYASDVHHAGLVVYMRDGQRDIGCRFAYVVIDDIEDAIARGIDGCINVVY